MQISGAEAFEFEQKLLLLLGLHIAVVESAVTVQQPAISLLELPSGPLGTLRVVARQILEERRTHQTERLADQSGAVLLIERPGGTRRSPVCEALILRRALILCRARMRQGESRARCWALR